MPSQRNLTEGAILRHLLALSLPIIASSFMYMAYNMANIFWVGRLSADDIAAVSGVGYIIWFGFSFSLISKVGSEVLLSQSIGKDRPQRIPYYVASSLQLSGYLSLAFAIVCAAIPQQIIVTIFSFNSPYVSHTAAVYLRVSAFGMFFMNINPVFSGILNGFGDTRSSFYILSAGIVLNIVLDPLFILGYGIIPPMGAAGAAFATVLSAMASTCIFVWIFAKHRRSAMSQIFVLRGNAQYIAGILRVGVPVATQITLFSVFAMLVTRIVTHWGDTPVAVVSIGGNIEAISWMTAGGISTALSTFVGQNYGAKKMQRLLHGYLFAIGISVVWGLMMTALLYFWGGDIVAMFNSDPFLVQTGWDYMRIVSLSQLFMCLEIATTGALSGIGRTMPSAAVSIGCNALRVAAAYLLAFYTPLGLDGVWWSISISSMAKGTVLVLTFLLIYRQMNSRIQHPVRQ